MATYITTDEFKLRTLLPANVLTQIEQVTPGWLAAQIDAVGHGIDARLSKRYVTPFRTPYPDILKSWIINIVSLNAWLKRGMVATDESFGEYKAMHDRALEEIREAANSETGLFDLPVDATQPGGASAIERANPRCYSEASPYVWGDVQRERGRSEDGSNNGTLR